MEKISRFGELAFLAALFALCLALVFVFQKDIPVAEAVIGGIGNVTDNDNPHNFAYGSTGVAALFSTETEICIFCHTPHRAIMNDDNIEHPLWNHTLSDATYTVKSQGSSYSNATAGVDIILLTDPGQPDGASRLCLSCHDGTVSVGTLASRELDISMQTACLGSGTGLVSGMLTIACDAYLGVDLTDKHVVSVPMNAGLLATSLTNCTSPPNQTTRLKYPWQTGYVGDARPGTVLLRPTLHEYDGNPGVTLGDAIIAGLDSPYDKKYKAGYNYGVQCSTCHDPHLWDDTTDQNQAGFKFLVDGFNALCQACHTTEGCS